MITDINLKYEFSICDKYISWGWTSREKNGEKILKGVALPMLKSVKKVTFNKNILIIPTVIDYLFKNRRTDKINEDLEIVDTLIANLDKRIKKI